MSTDKNNADVVNELLCQRVKELEADRDSLVEQIDELEHQVSCPHCLARLLEAAMDKIDSAGPAEGDFKAQGIDSVEAGGVEYVKTVIRVPADSDIKTPADLPYALKQMLAANSIEIDNVEIQFI